MQSEQFRVLTTTKSRAKILRWLIHFSPSPPGGLGCCRF